MKIAISILPQKRKLLQQMGEQFKLARLRRKLSSAQVAERANISRTTLWNIEKGDPGVALGNYFTVLMILNLENDIVKLASDDELGRNLQDLNLITKKRAPKK